MNYTTPNGQSHYAIDSSACLCKGVFKERQQRVLPSLSIIQRNCQPCVMRQLAQESQGQKNGKEKYPLNTSRNKSITLCGHTVTLSNEQLATALLSLSERKQKMIYLYFSQRYPQRIIGSRYGRSRSSLGNLMNN